jgi:hypothetical protein
MNRTFLKTALILTASFALADDTMTLKSSLEAIGELFPAIATIFTGAAYVAGLMLFVGAIFKFRQHREAPQQVPIGQPLSLFGLSVLAVFLPGFLNLTGAFFNDESAGAAGDISVLPGADSSGGGDSSS